MKQQTEHANLSESERILANKRIRLFVYISFLFVYISVFSTALALNMESDSYRIQMGNLNMGAGRPSSSSYDLDLTMGQTAPGEYTNTGFKVLAGFQYIHSLIPFTFTIFEISIDFGTLTSNYFNEQTNDLTISCGSAGGYQVTVLANKQLTSQASSTIPKTTCGDPACTISQAQPWTSTDYDGFGHNMSGDDIPDDFEGSTYFRPFPDEESGDSAKIVMNGSNVGRNLQSTVTYRINISGSQAAGNYENFLTFVATPTF